MSNKCNGCKHYEERLSGSMIIHYCALNECVYADMVYDLRTACDQVKEIIQDYDNNDLDRAAGFERIKKIMEGIE